MAHMSTPRYYPRYHSKEGFEERYVVVDSRTGDELSPPKPYHEANDEAGARNDGTFGVLSMADWVPGLNLTP